LEKALEWNYLRGFLFYRLHPAFFPAGAESATGRLSALGRWIRDRGMRLTVRFNLPFLDVVRGEETEAAVLVRTALFLDALDLDPTNKIQIGVPLGTGSAERGLNLKRFDERYRRLPDAVQRRLVVETSAGRLGLRDCLAIWSALGLPVVYRSGAASRDVIATALARSAATWSEDDGLPTVDYCGESDAVAALLANAPVAD
jgi:UV DNA damage endonuclease